MVKAPPKDCGREHPTPLCMCQACVDARDPIKKRGRPQSPAPAGFPARLRQAREAVKLTPEAAAAAVDVHLDTWLSWERGDNEPRVRTMVKLAKLLSADPIWLVLGPDARRK